MLSVIIPTLNEEKGIKNVLVHLQKYPDCEVIVVDGGSSDNTVAVASSCRAKVIISAASRATQMNSGAKEAKGDILLFLHADTTLPNNFIEQIRKTLSCNNVIAGAFELAIDLPGAGARFIEKVVNFRARFLQMPYGDQAIFMKKEMFVRQGGFDEVEFLEDFIFIRRLKKHGNIGIARSKVITSGRRWRKKGLLQTTLINQLIIIGYLFGFPLTLLKKLYGVAKK